VFKKLSILILTILMLVSINSIVISQKEYNDIENDHGIISFIYNFGNPTYSAINIKGEEFDRINLGDLPFSEKLGEPKLPVKPLKILLPYSTDIKQISLETSEKKILQNTNVKNIELGGLSHRLDNASVQREIVPQFKKEELYPEKLYNNLGIQSLNGYLILFVNLHPVRYLGETGTVYYYNEIKISIETEEKNYDTILKKYSDRDKVERLVENPQILDTYPDESINHSFGLENYEYVIITTEDLINASKEFTFNDLIDQRESQGLSCKIKSVEDIKKEYQGVDTQEKIRNFIRDAYLTWDTKWILLGGDVEKVPIRYLHDIDGVEKDETEITSDVYYQCLDGNYNYDEDGIWGEEFDGVNGKTIDLLAEVYVGRAPVDDEDDVSSFVEKTLSYENSDWNEDLFTQNVLSAGEDLWSGPGGDGSGYVERCIDYCTDYNQDTYGIPSDKYTITRLYESLGSWTDEDAMNVINNGVSIINHVGHGTSLAAMKLTNFEIDELENSGKYCLFYSQACHSGQLEKHDECFAEKWVNVPKKGGFAAIMNTGYGYGSSNNYDGADNRYAREFFDALFSPNEKISRIGEANQDSKEDNIWHIDERNMYHAYYDTILLGDPYVSIKGAEEASALFTYRPDYPKTNEIINFEDKSLGIITYRQWSFGDGHTSNKKNPNHVYGSEGAYKVTLTVQDNQGYLSTTSETIEVKKYWNPIAKITPSSYNGVNFKIEFSAAESWDPDGSIDNYYWDFDDGTTSNLIEPTHIYEEEGTYHVSLLVEDDEGNLDREYSTIILSMQYPPEIPEIIDGTTSTFTGSFPEFSVVSTDPEEDEIQYGWDFKDESEIQWTDWFLSGEICTISHKWSKTGTFLVKVKARDENYGESNWSEEIIVTVSDEKAPYLEVLKPTKGIYIQNEKKMPFFSSVIFGNIDVTVNASDASGIEKVLFYIDNGDNPVAEALSSPYIFIWQDSMFFRHKLRIVAIDKVGKETSSEITVWKFF